MCCGCVADVGRVWCRGVDGRVECRIEWDDMGWEEMASFIVISFVLAQSLNSTRAVFSGLRLDGSVRC